MGSSLDYDVFTLSTGPHKGVDECLNELSNHVGTFITEVTVESGRVVSVSHSVFEMQEGLHASAVIVIEA